MYHVIDAYISCSITIIGVILFARIILNDKINITKTQLLTVFLLATFIYTYFFLNYEGTIKTIIMIIINVILYQIIFKINYLKSILLNIMHIFILLISDSLSLFLYTKLLNISKDYFYEQMAGKIISNITVCLLLVLFTYVFKNILRKFVNYKLETNINIIGLSIFTFICIIMFFHEFINEYAKSDHIISYILLMAVSILILFSLLKQTIENNKLMKKYDKLLEFMTTYEEEIENQRILRHENKNEILNIKGQILDNNKKDKIIEYIDNILKDKNKVKYEEYAKFKYLPANGIKGLCYFKVQEAQNRGIIVGINISSQIEKSNIYNLTTKEQRDFGKILGVFLDNAIEASIDSKDKKLGIEAYNKNGEFQMIISNTYNNKLETDKIGKKKYSTKDKNRGHGLLLVKHIIENNNIFEIETKPNPTLYIQYIKIKKSN